MQLRVFLLLTKYTCTVTCTYMGTRKKKQSKKEDMVLPLTEARKNIFRLVEKSQLNDKPYIFTHRGRARAVLMSYEQYDSLLETIDVYKNPETSKALWEHANTPYNPDDYESLEDVMKELGLERDASGNIQDVQRSTTKKGKKKSGKNR